MKIRPLICGLGLLLPLIVSAADKAALKAELIATERAFAKLVSEKGFKEGFLAYMAPDGFFSGALTLSREEFEKKPSPPPPPGVTLDWEPLFADVADSGELGYTWGYFRIKAPPAEDGKPRGQQGVTVTIWKKQADGSWKFVYDGGPPVPAAALDAFLKREDLPNRPTH